MAIPVVVLCLLLELGLRVYYTGEGQPIADSDIQPVQETDTKPVALHESSDHLKIHALSDNPVLGYELVPNSQNTNWGVINRINSSGFRDDDYPEEKPKNTKRIIVLGDSWTYGWGVELKNTFVKNLEELINFRVERYRVEVLNFGVCGYSVIQAVEFGREKAVRYDPDVIVLAFHINDISHSMPLYNHFLQLRMKQSGGSKLSQFLLGKTSIAMEEIREQQALSSDKSIPHFIRMYRTPKYWDSVTESFETLAALGEKHSAPVVLFLLPNVKAYCRVHPDVYDQIVTAGKENRFMVCDSSKKWNILRRKRPLKFEDNEHPNPAGHFVLASILSDFLAEHVFR